MSKTKKTYKEFLEIVDFIKLIDTKPKDKLSWATMQLTKYLMQFTAEKYNAKIKKINIETCSVDEAGNFILDKNGEIDLNVITKENQAKRDKLKEDLLKETVEIETFYVTDYTRVKKLSPYILEALNGLLWKLTDKQIEDFFLSEGSDVEGDKK